MTFLMLDLGPHAAFIVWSYAATLLVVAGLLLWAILGEWQQQRFIDELEKRGLSRGGSTSHQEAQ
jgi:heme exporter protein D